MLYHMPLRSYHFKYKAFHEALKGTYSCCRVEKGQGWVGVRNQVYSLSAQGRFSCKHSSIANGQPASDRLLLRNQFEALIKHLVQKQPESHIPLRREPLYLFDFCDVLPQAGQHMRFYLLNSVVSYSFA